MTVNCVIKNGDILKCFGVVFPVQCNLQENTITFKNINGKCYNLSLSDIVFFEVFNESPINLKV